MRTKTTLALLLAIFMCLGGVFAQGIELPRFATDLERQSNLPPRLLIGINTPPTSPVRTMAEWEELQALLITWSGQSTILTEIVRAARLECIVVISCFDEDVVNEAKAKLSSSGVDISSNVQFVLAPYNSIWVRDYGPNCVYANDVDSLYFVDWIYNRPTRPDDDTLSTTIAPYFNVPLYSTSAAPADLVNTGGNFMADGMGTAFASELILEENDFGNPYGVTNKAEPQIDDILSDYMGIERYIKMSPLPFDAIHHIDMHMKLLDEETLLVGKYPTGIADGPQIEANIQYVLNNFQSSFGTPYKVVRIPMPPKAGQYPNTGADYRTYANAVFVNKTIIVPFYQQQYDTTARRIWQEAMPGYKVVGINCNSIIPSLGAIHCITKEVGVDDPLRIVHKPIEGVLQNAFGPDNYPVTALIQHKSGIASAQVFYRQKTATTWSSVSMSPATNPDSSNYWTGLIPKQEAYFDTLFYYIEGLANSGKTQVRPLPGPAGAWKFLIQANISSTEAPVAELLEIYPNPAAAITVIPVQSSAKTRGSVLLYNSLGQMVLEIFEGEIPAGNTNYFLDAGKFAAGTYWVKLQTGNQVGMKKLVVR